VLVHLAALGALFVGFEWYYPLVALGSYYFRMFWVTVGYHRYFSHRSFKTSRPFQFVIAFMAMTSAQKGVLWWAAHHRDHHKYSDTPQDLHSPLQSGLWWSHVGWVMSPKFNATNFDRIRDFARFPELRWLNRWYLVPPVVYFAVLGLVGGLPLILWGGVIGTVLLWHGSFTVNSLAHLYGTRRYQTSDGSRNNWWLALLTCGEGWHNNHHHYQSSANQGWFWWEIDASYYGLKLFSWLRLVSDLRKPPAHIRDALPPTTDSAGEGPRVAA
jgi:stearoyl-CoA desaturase (delta-9 desaturase)